MDVPHSHHRSPHSGASNSVMAVAFPLPSVSITTIEGDPPDVEEDSGDLGDDDMAGKFFS